MTNATTSQINTGQAVTLYWEARQHGWLHKLWALITRRTFRLLELEETLRQSQLSDSHYAGMKTVDIHRIAGTQGKADAFDAEFNPIKENTRTRWINIMLEKLRGKDLPPVDLVEVNGVYYVRDGHHRISVARTLGQQFIDAEVTVWNLQCRWR